MTIYEILKNDHDQLKPLLSELVQATEMNRDVKDLLRQIDDLLIPHARAEEAIFYNALREGESAQAKEKVRHGYSEHMQAEALLRTLQGLSMIGVEWTTAAEKLKDSLEHHIQEEETEIFSVAQNVFSEEEAKELGRAFEALKIEFQSQGSLKNSVEMISNLIPRRFKDTYRDYVGRL